jgi:hypothetical protein
MEVQKAVTVLRASLPDTVFPPRRNKYAPKRTNDDVFRWLMQNNAEARELVGHIIGGARVKE